MWNRTQAYGTGGKESEALAADIKKHLRNVTLQPVLSKPWLAMAESLQHIATVASLERSTAKDSGRTLFESHEIAIKCLLDDGKLNVCLRNLKEFKDFRRKADADPAVIQPFAAAMGGPDAVEARLNVYERSLGALLDYACGAVEVLQLIDMPLLLQHCGEVLSYALGHPKVMNQLTSDSLQETLVFSYLDSVAAKLDQLQEDRIVGFIEEYKLVSLVVRNLSIYYSLYPRNLLMHGLMFLSRTMESEDFQTYKRKFLSPEDERLIGGFAVLKDLAPAERAKLHAVLKLAR